MRSVLAIMTVLLLQACASAPDAQPSNTAQYNDMFPVWRPDGRAITFLSDRSGDPEIYSVGVDGTGLRRLTNTPGRDAHAVWMPDGRTILFQSPRNGGDIRVFAMDADGGHQRELAATSGFCGVPTPSPDGTRIAFMCSAAREGPGSAEAPWRLFLMNADGGGIRQITNGPGNDQVANWSPDGQRVVFWSDRDGRDHIYTLDFSSGAVTQLTSGSHTNRSALYSPDGQTIYFGSDRAGGWALHAMPASGGEARFVTAFDSPFGISYPSPDGREMLIGVATANGLRIGLLNLETGARTMIDTD